MKQLYDEVSMDMSKYLTKRYSTSFTTGIKLFCSSIRADIFAIYGFVRVADEIVDSFFPDFPQEKMLLDFEEDTFDAIDLGISTNPILNSFQHTVNKYDIDHDLIRAFLKSMKMDLNKVHYSQDKYEEYIYGSAEVVGLMCLQVFLNVKEKYEKLKPSAKALGAAFQKVNFLRDLKHDYQELDRTYFPGVDFSEFTEVDKADIVKDIEADFKESLLGIKQLPKNSRLGVYIAYVYFYMLLKKIKKTPAAKIKNKRIRVNDYRKCYLLSKGYVAYKFNML